MRSKIISIKVKTNSEFDFVKKVDHPDFIFKVNVKEIPEKGKANEKVLELLARYLGLEKRSLSLLSGEKSEIKLIEIHE